jgi:hypothetical protein
MDQLFLLMSASMSREDILTRLKEAIDDHILIPDEEKENEILMYAHMYIINKITDGDINKAKDMEKNYELFKEREKLFSPNSN